MRLAREDGRFGAAIQALGSSGVAEPGPVTTKILREKHPMDKRIIELGFGPQPPEFSQQAMVFDEDSVRESLRSFPRGTACGRSGLRAAHLLEMVGCEVPDFLKSFTAVLNIAVSGRASEKFAPFMASAILVPLLKKDRTIRPVAVGEVFRRLVSKLSFRKVFSRSRAWLMPVQVGVGVSGATEALLHGLNRLLQSDRLPPEAVVVLVDFVNAFNTADRFRMYAVVKEHLPDLLPWVHYIYGCEALLFSGSDVIGASAGVQQGDPLGPLLFAMTLQPLLLELQARFGGGDLLNIAAFLDDLTLVTSNFDSACNCIGFLREVGPTFGLHVSIKKSVTWQPPDLRRDRSFEGGPRQRRTGPRSINGVRLVHDPGIELLGGAVSNDFDFVTDVVMRRVRKCSASIDLLFQLEDPQLVLLLLRSCLGMAQMTYTWRTHDPRLILPCSIAFEQTIINALRWIVVSGGPRFGNFQQTLASLPVAMGGLGIPLPSDLLNFAFLASRFHTFDLQKALFPQLSVAPNGGWRDFLYHVDRFVGTLHPADKPQDVGDFSLALVDTTLPLQNKQQHLAVMYNKSKRRYLLQHEFLRRPAHESVLSQHRYILDAFAAPLQGSTKPPLKAERLWVSLASQWLFASPNPKLGQFMEPCEFRAALCFRLLIPYASFSRPCPAVSDDSYCDATMDAFGYHALDCNFRMFGRFNRHEILAEAVNALAASARFRPFRNAPVTCLGVSNYGGTFHFRPADVLLQGDEEGPHCVDCTVVSPLGPGKSDSRSGKDLGRSAADAAEAKIKKHHQPCSDASRLFTPFSVDVCGFMDQDASDLLRRFAGRIGQQSGRGFRDALTLCRRRVSFAIQLGVARQLVPLFRLMREDGDESLFLSA